MKSKARTELLRQMPGLSQKHLAPLSEEAVKDLSALFAESRSHQRQALDAAIEKSMRHVPLLLRGPLKRILFP